MTKTTRKRKPLRTATVTAGMALAALALSAAAPTAAAATEAADRPADFYQERALEIQAYVEEQFGDAVPQAEAVTVRLPADDNGNYSDDMGYLTHFVEFDDAIGHTGIALQYDEAGHYDQTPEQICGEWEVETCDTEELSDGSTLVTTTAEAAPGGYRWLTVHHFRTDATVTWGTSYTYDPIWDGDEGPLREDFAVAADQLTTLVTDPELTL